jgi:hypothetical protein
VTDPDGVAVLRVTPTRALLHRNAAEPDSDALHDCVVFSAP